MFLVIFLRKTHLVDDDVASCGGVPCTQLSVQTAPEAGNSERMRQYTSESRRFARSKMISRPYAP